MIALAATTIVTVSLISNSFIGAGNGILARLHRKVHVCVGRCVTGSHDLEAAATRSMVTNRLALSANINTARSLSPARLLSSGGVVLSLFLAFIATTIGRDVLVDKNSGNGQEIHTVPLATELGLIFGGIFASLLLGGCLITSVIAFFSRLYRCCAGLARFVKNLSRHGSPGNVSVTNIDNTYILNKSNNASISGPGQGLGSSSGRPGASERRLAKVINHQLNSVVKEVRDVQKKMRKRDMVMRQAARAGAAGSSNASSGSGTHGHGKHHLPSSPKQATILDNTKKVPNLDSGPGSSPMNRHSSSGTSSTESLLHLNLVSNKPVNNFKSRDGSPSLGRDNKGRTDSKEIHRNSMDISRRNSLLANAEIAKLIQAEEEEALARRRVLEEADPDAEGSPHSSEAEASAPGSDDDEDDVVSGESGEVESGSASKSGDLQDNALQSYESSTSEEEDQVKHHHLDMENVPDVIADADKAPTSVSAAAAKFGGGVKLRHSAHLPGRSTSGESKVPDSKKGSESSQIGASPPAWMKPKLHHVAKASETVNPADSTAPGPGLEGTKSTP